MNGVHRAIAIIGLALTMAPAGGRADELVDRIDRMERELQELRAELRKRRTTEEAPAATTAPAPAPAPAETTAGRRIEVPAALGAVIDRVKLGGYGSFRYEGSSLEDQKNTFTYRRFVLTTDANIAPRLRAYLELEFERFRKLELEKASGPEEGGLEVEQTVEGTSDSEIALEQAWLQYDLYDWLSFRGGGVLVPLGRFNLNHDDNRWNLPRRSLVDRGVPVLPTTSAWDELGVGFVGGVPVGREGRLDYQAYVMNGVALDFEFEQIAQTRSPEPGKLVIEAKLEPSTGTFGRDVKDAKAGAGRLAYSPLLGHEIAGSFYAGQYTPDFLGSKNLWALGLDGLTTWGPFDLEGQYVFTRFENIDGVARALARVARDQAVEFENSELETEVEYELSGLARTRQGYWLEGRYRFWPSVLSDTALGRYFENPLLVAVVRGEQAWLSGYVTEVEFGGGRLTTLDTEGRLVNRITAGLAYRPVPLVVFQLAYEFTRTNEGKSLSGVTNHLTAGAGENTAHTVLVGAAFGF
jgi:hypothetical protein